jgi:subtilisin family serine protease
MSEKDLTTRVAGEPLRLEATEGRFVSRAPKAMLEKEGFEVIEQLSTSSFAVAADNTNVDAQMARARDLGSAAYPYYRVANTNRDFLISNRVFVRFREKLSKEQVISFAQEYDVDEMDRYDDEVLLRLPATADPVGVVNNMSADARVELAEHDLNHRVAPLELASLVGDADYAEQWHLHDDRPSSPMFHPPVSAQCDDAWTLLGNFGSSNVVIGITDGGVDLTNLDFRTSTTESFNGRNAGSDRFAGWGYFRGHWILTNLSSRALVSEMGESARHGTAMAAIIGAAVNGESAVGVAPGCRLLPVKFQIAEGKLLVATSRVRTAFRFLSNRADVISNSWGIGPDALWGRMFRDEIERMAISGGLRQKGVVFVWAAGNSNCPIAQDLLTEADVPIDNGRDGIGRFVGPKTSRVFRNDLVGIPALIHVGAVASTGHRSHYSNYGSGLRLCAPSDNTHLYGFGGVVPDSLPVRSSPSTSVLQTAPGGTSTATAIVAGVAGLVISANPELTSQEVVSILQQTATKDLVTTPYAEPRDDFRPIDRDGTFKDIGHPDGTWSPWFGFGAVNARAAVAKALELTQKPSTPEKEIYEEEAVPV